MGTLGYEKKFKSCVFHANPKINTKMRYNTIRFVFN